MRDKLKRQDNQTEYSLGTKESVHQYYRDGRITGLKCSWSQRCFIEGASIVLKYECLLIPFCVIITSEGLKIGCTVPVKVLSQSNQLYPLLSYHLHIYIRPKLYLATSETHIYIIFLWFFRDKRLVTVKGLIIETNSLVNRYRSLDFL